MSCFLKPHISPHPSPLSRPSSLHHPITKHRPYPRSLLTIPNVSRTTDLASTKAFVFSSLPQAREKCRVRWSLRCDFVACLPCRRSSRRDCILLNAALSANATTTTAAPRVVPTSWTLPPQRSFRHMPLKRRRSSRGRHTAQPLSHAVPSPWVYVVLYVLAVVHRAVAACVLDQQARDTRCRCAQLLPPLPCPAPAAGTSRGLVVPNQPHVVDTRLGDDGACAAVAAAAAAAAAARGGGVAAAVVKRGVRGVVVFCCAGVRPRALTASICHPLEGLLRSVATGQRLTSATTTRAHIRHRHRSTHPSVSVMSCHVMLCS